MLFRSIMTDRFVNGNTSNDGATTGAAQGADWQGGDFSGVTSMINAGYFAELGVNALWLTPFNTAANGTGKAADGVHDVAAFHGYWPVEARGVDPRLGTPEELETMIDTAMTLNAMHPDVLIVRHPDAGAVKLLSEKVNASVINAGDGRHEHPTQALLDALTILRRRGRLQNLIVAICGDVMHSRVARSNIHLLTTMGARVRVVAPRTLLPAAIDRFGVEVYHDMREGLTDCDIVMMLRLQTERMRGTFVPSIREYFHFFGLDNEKLSYAKKDAFVMHPGPMNRGVEIDSQLADDIDRSVIRDQVEMGVAVRMACLDLLTRTEIAN